MLTIYWFVLYLSYLPKASSDFGAIGSSSLGWLEEELVPNDETSFVDPTLYDFDITFPHNTQDLGLLLDSTLKIQSMEDSKAAEMTGYLQEGDTLISINGEDISSLDFKEVSSTLKALQSKEKWFWLRFRPSRLAVRHRLELYDHNVTATLEDVEGARLGLMLTSGLKIHAIVDNSPMWEDGVVKQGDILVSVDDEILTGQSLSYVSNVLQSATGTISFRFRLSAEERRKRRHQDQRDQEKQGPSSSMTTNINLSLSSSSSSSSTSSSTYTVVFNTLQDLGMIIKDGDFSITGFKQSRDGGPSPAERDGRVHKGDVVVSVDGEDIKRLSKATKLLGQYTHQEVLKCRGGKVTRYCSIERIEPKTTSRVVVLRRGLQHYRRTAMLLNRQHEDQHNDEQEKNSDHQNNLKSLSSTSNEVHAPDSTSNSASIQETTPTSLYMNARKAAAGTIETTRLMPSGKHEHVFHTTRGAINVNANFSLDFSNSLFGGSLPCLYHSAVLSQPMDACLELTNHNVDVRNAYVIVKRGGCFFSSKAINVQYAGAAGLIIIDNPKRDVYGKVIHGDVGGGDRAQQQRQQQSLPERMPANANDGHLVKIPVIAINHIAGLRLMSVLDTTTKLRLCPENPEDSLCPDELKTLPEQTQTNKKDGDDVVTKALGRGN